MWNLRKDTATGTRMTGSKKRRVIITKSYNLLCWEHLAHHPQARKCWQLPEDYMLVEISDPGLKDTPQSSTDSRRIAIASLKEAQLFVPFYRRMKSLAEIATLHVSTQTASYHFITDSRKVLQWPPFSVSPGWETGRVIQVECLLTSDLIGRFQFLQSVLSEWAVCMRQLKQLQLFAPIISEPRKYAVACEFAQGCGDPTMALLMLLSDARASTCMRSVAFRPPDWRKRQRKKTRTAQANGEVFQESLQSGTI